MRALVMAGGRGRRLGDLTRKTPKPLMPLGEGTVLSHIVESLRGHTIRDIYVSANYMADKVVDYCVAELGLPPSRVICETSYLGTGGAVALVPGKGPLLVVNGDVVSDINFAELVEEHRRRDHHATAVVAHHEYTVPYGVVATNGAISEKPLAQWCVLAGVYVLSAETVAAVPTTGTAVSLPPFLVEQGKLALYEHYGYWKDVGRPEDLEQARKDLAS